MLQLIKSVTTVQQSAVTQLPANMGAAEDLQISPLPFGPKERQRYFADGAVETATPAEVGLDSEESARELFFVQPKKNAEMQMDCPDAASEAYHVAVRANLPLRSQTGQVVDADQWKATSAEESRLLLVIFLLARSQLIDLGSEWLSRRQLCEKHFRLKSSYESFAKMPGIS